MTTPASSFPPRPKEEKVFFPSTDSNHFQIEGLLVRGDRPWGVVLAHPHPLHGGTMRNKVIDSSMRAAATIGCSTLRFNYRGVGLSEGSYGDGVGEVHDLRAAIRFLRKEADVVSILLIGFSFGTGVVSRYVQIDKDVDGVVLIAPPLNMNELPVFQPPEKWGLGMILGEQDEFCSINAFHEYAAEFERIRYATVLENTGHFFHGHLPSLVTLVQDMLI